MRYIKVRFFCKSHFYEREIDMANRLSRDLVLKCAHSSSIYSESLIYMPAENLKSFRHFSEFHAAQLRGCSQLSVNKEEFEARKMHWSSPKQAFLLQRSKSNKATCYPLSEQAITALFTSHNN